MPAPRLLFADDELTIRPTLPAILEKHGFDVTVVASVPDALEAIGREKFDVLLSDLNIGQPGDGFTIVSAMRRSQPEAVTLIITGYPDFDTALQAIRNQVDDYVTKPVSIDHLIEAIKLKLANRQRTFRALPTKRVHELLREHKKKFAHDGSGRWNRPRKLP